MEGGGRERSQRRMQIAVIDWIHGIQFDSHTVAVYDRCRDPIVVKQALQINAQTLEEKSRPRWILVFRGEEKGDDEVEDTLS